MNLRVVDFFAGGGGLSMGFQKAGFDVVCAVENWEPALDIYRANFHQHDAVSLDLRDEKCALRLLDTYRPDVIIGGPPCQDFSSAGKRDEDAGRASLTIHYANTISQYRPAFFVMENVARAANSKAFRVAQAVFSQAGYGLTMQVLDAAYCGAPQSRKRLFVIGHLHGKDGFLTDALLAGLSEKPMTLRQFFKGQLGVEHYYRHPRSYARRAVFSIDEPSPTIRGVNRPVPKGCPGHPGDTVPVTADIRSLTTQERAWIQTFPRDFVFPGTKSDVEQVIGNAVPVRLAQYVADKLGQYILELDANGFATAGGDLFEGCTALQVA